MKKILTLAFVFVFAYAAYCADQPAQQKTVSNEWEFLSLAFFPGFPEPANTVTVNGLKIGIPVSFGKQSTVNGIEASFAASTTNEVNGVQTAPFFTDGGLIRGLQFSVVNVARECRGLQLGIVNVAEEGATQIGLLNFIKGSPLKCMIIFNCGY